MSRWKDLPESLDPRLRQLVVQLREHKDRSGLSIAALSSRTGFGKSSWDRYLNGRILPPEEAVEALARACDTEAAPLLELRELAVGAAEPSASVILDTGDTGDTGDTRDTREAEDVRPSAPRPPVPWLAIVLSSVSTSLVMLVGLLLLAPWEDDGMTGTAAPAAEAKPYTGAVHPSFGAFAYQAGTTYECQVERDAEDGLLYAGYSRTRSENVQRDAARWAVVEAQCLLEHHGISPGVVDGAFGNNTDRAVRRLQDRAKIAVDGIVGPDTWKVLRT